MNDLTDLKKLSPEERVKKLKEIEERSRKEIEEAQKLMGESIREIEIEQGIKEKMPIPQLAAVDIDSLFTIEEKDMFKTNRFVSAKKEPIVAEKKEFLDELIEKEKPQDVKETHKQYGQAFDEMNKDIISAYQGGDHGGRDDPMKQAYDQNKEGPGDSYHKGGSDELREMSSLGEQITKGHYKR